MSLAWIVLANSLLLAFPVEEKDKFTIGSTERRLGARRARVRALKMNAFPVWEQVMC